MPPRENLFFGAGILAGVFALFAALDWTPPAEADTHAAQQARQELRRDLAAAKACEPGSFAVWLGPASIECRKEIKP